jgi:hypothetical protein
MSTSTLNGVACMRARVSLPAWGVAFAECTLDRPETLSGAVELVLADLTFRGTIVSGGPWEGRSSYRLVAGAGGWSQSVSSADYANDAGVKYSQVVGELAADVGETVEGVPSGTVGPKWVRAADAASLVLHQLFPRAWRVGADGVTRFGQPPAFLVDAAITRGQVDLAAGHVELMADAIAALVPGASAAGVVASDVVHELEGSKLRTHLWGSSLAPTSKRLAAWSKLLEQLDPLRRFRGLYEYRVVTQETERLNLQPVRVALGVPELRRVRVRPGVAGCRATVALGSTVLVAFVNADPSRPVVVGFEDAESDGFMPLELDLGEAPRLGVARITDAVVAGPFGGTITGGSARVKAGL